MKKILIAATLVGSAAAGLILYYTRRNKGQERIEGAARDAYKTMNDGIGKVERRGQHAMG